MQLRFSPRHTLACLLIFLTEVYIALYVHDDLIRPLGGDALVVILVWAAWLSVVRSSPYITALGALLFCYAVEIGQYFRLVDLLGLGHSRIARIVLGTSFDVQDLGAYTLGAAVLCAGCRCFAACRSEQRSFRLFR